MNRRAIQVVGGVIKQGDKVLLVQRPPHDTGAGFWEFPGGKIEHGESPEQALLRELEEELGIRVKIVEDLGWGFHAYPQVDIDMRLFIVDWQAGELVLNEHSGLRWLLPQQILLDELLEADRPFVEKILVSKTFSGMKKQSD